jgi:hypothetical protein
MKKYRFSQKMHTCKLVRTLLELRTASVMKPISFFEIVFIVALFHGCGPSESGDFPSASSVVPNETAAFEQQTRCLSSQWLSQPDGMMEAKTLGELIKLCDDGKPPFNSDS